MAPKGLGLAAAATRSGARRYPRELMDSLRFCKGPECLAVPFEMARAPLAAAWLGHATVLVRIGDAWVLTDPVFSSRVGVRLGPLTVGVGRRTPAPDPSMLPPIDLILLSHAHFDHLDKPTLRRLVSKRTVVVTAANTRCLIPRGYGEVREMAWGEEAQVAGLTLRAIRPNHWGARTAWDKHRGFNSYVFSLSESRRRVLFTGDTAMTNAYDHLRGEGGVDLSIFGIGAYNPWLHAHANPEQAWAMHIAAGGRYLLPMHHSTFKLSDEPMGEPMTRLLAAAGEQNGTVVARDVGQVWSEAR